MKRIILAGAAGSGKDYLRDKFEEKGFKIDVSITTRPMRDGEVEGKTYQYVSEEFFGNLGEEAGFYEAVQFNGAHYGTTRKSWKESEIFIMTPSGIKHITEKDRGRCVIVYLNIDEAIRRERMLERSDNGFDKIERRVEADNKDFEGFIRNVDFLIGDPLFDAEILIKNVVRYTQ